MFRPAIIIGWACLALMLANGYRSYQQYRKGSLTRANLVNQIYSVVILLMILLGFHLAGLFTRHF